VSPPAAGWSALAPAGARLKAAIAPSLWDCLHCPFKFPCDIEAMKTVRRFLAVESGATAIEYGLIAAGIAIAIITAVQGVGTKLSSNFAKISTSLK
jgi:pilus assembly protein Flp/PilA